MRWLCLALCACGRSFVADAGTDGGESDAGGSAVSPAVATFPYLDAKPIAPTYDCGSVEACSIVAHNDGGLAHWKVVYADAGYAAAGCTFDLQDEAVVIDCRAMCKPDSGNESINATCCLNKPRYASNGMCGWSPH